MQVFLTLKGKQANLPSGGVLDRLNCARCESRGYGCLPDYPPLMKYKEVAVDRPLAKEEFDQWFMTPEHALHRIGFIHARGDLLNKRILIIGDDDLVGIAAAITGNTRFFSTSAFTPHCPLPCLLTCMCDFNSSLTTSSQVYPTKW